MSPSTSGLLEMLIKTRAKSLLAAILLSYFLVGETIVVAKGTNSLNPKSLNFREVLSSGTDLVRLQNTQTKSYVRPTCRSSIDDHTGCSSALRSWVENDRSSAFFGLLEDSYSTCQNHVKNVKPTVKDDGAWKNAAERIQPSLLKEVRSCGLTLNLDLEAKTIYTLSRIEPAQSYLLKQLQFIDSFVDKKFLPKTPDHSWTCSLPQLPLLELECQNACPNLNEDQKTEWGELSQFNQKLLDQFLSESDNRTKPPISFNELKELKIEDRAGYSEDQKRALALKLILQSESPWLLKDDYRKAIARGLKPTLAMQEQFIVDRSELIKKWQEGQRTANCFTKPLETECEPRRFAANIQTYPELQTSLPRLKLQQCVADFTHERNKTAATLEAAAKSTVGSVATLAAIRLARLGFMASSVGLNSAVNSAGVWQSISDAQQNCWNQLQLETENRKPTCAAPSTLLSPKGEDCRKTLIFGGLSLLPYAPILIQAKSIGQQVSRELSNVPRNPDAFSSELLLRKRNPDGNLGQQRPERAEKGIQTAIKSKDSISPSNKLASTQKSYVERNLPADMLPKELEGLEVVEACRRATANQLCIMGKFNGMKDLNDMGLSDVGSATGILLTKSLQEVRAIHSRELEALGMDPNGTGVFWNGTGFIWRLSFKNKISPSDRRVKDLLKTMEDEIVKKVEGELATALGRRHVGGVEVNVGRTAHEAEIYARNPLATEFVDPDFAYIRETEQVKEAYRHAKQGFKNLDKLAEQGEIPKEAITVDTEGGVLLSAKTLEVLRRTRNEDWKGFQRKFESATGKKLTNRVAQEIYQIKNRINQFTTSPPTPRLEITLQNANFGVMYFDVKRLGPLNWDRVQKALKSSSGFSKFQGQSLEAIESLTFDLDLMRSSLSKIATTIAEKHGLKTELPMSGDDAPLKVLGRVDGKSPTREEVKKFFDEVMGEVGRLGQRGVPGEKTPVASLRVTQIFDEQQDARDPLIRMAESFEKEYSTLSRLPDRLLEDLHLTVTNLSGTTDGSRTLHVEWSPNSKLSSKEFNEMKEGMSTVVDRINQQLKEKNSNVQYQLTLQPRSTSP